MSQLIRLRRNFRTALRLFAGLSAAASASAHAPATDDRPSASVAIRTIGPERFIDIGESEPFAPRKSETARHGPCIVARKKQPWLAGHARIMALRLPRARRRSAY